MGRASLARDLFDAIVRIDDRLEEMAEADFCGHANAYRLARRIIIDEMNNMLAGR